MFQFTEFQIVVECVETLYGFDISPYAFFL